VTALRDDPDGAVGAHPSSTTTRSDYIERVCAGGFPLALNRAGAARNRWFDGYVDQSIERDALELARIRRRQVLRELLGRLAGRTGQVVNLSMASEGLGADRHTIEEHTRFLEDLFLLARLPARGKTLRARAAASPKIHVVDSGLAARLMGVTPAKLATLDPTVLTECGNLAEKFVVGELRKQISWLDERVTVGHWRTHDRDEVDFIIDFDHGAVLELEVKAKERISGTDFKGPRKLRAALGDRLIAGVALTTGVLVHLRGPPARDATRPALATCGPLNRGRRLFTPAHAALSRHGGDELTFFGHCTQPDLPRRRVFTNVPELIEAITTWGSHWNDDSKPLIWLTSAAEIIKSPARSCGLEAPGQFNDGALGRPGRAQCPRTPARSEA
jgi:Domain of unknown function (DUF4143)